MWSIECVIKINKFFGKELILNELEKLYQGYIVTADGGFGSIRIDEAYIEIPKELRSYEQIVKDITNIFKMFSIYNDSEIMFIVRNNSENVYERFDYFTDSKIQYFHRFIPKEVWNDEDNEYLIRRNFLLKSITNSVSLKLD